MSGKSVIVLGATGMVGGHALQLSLDEPGVSSVTVVGRRSTGASHPKLREILHDDFMDYAEALGASSAGRSMRSGGRTQAWAANSRRSRKPSRSYRP